MRKLQSVFYRALVALLLLTGVQAAGAEIAVIVNPNTQVIGLSRDTIADIYLDKKKTYPNGTRIKPVDQSSSSPVRKKFYQSVVKMTDSEVNRYWSKLKFTGKGRPPKTISGDEAVKNWVASNPGAIGYIDGKYLDKSVKVILIIP